MGRSELPRVGEIRLMTVGEVAERLGMSETAIRYRADKGIFPPPTQVDENGNRWFSAKWLEEAQAIRAKEEEKW